MEDSCWNQTYRLWALSLLLLKVVPEQAGLVGDVEAGVEAEAGAQPPLVVAQHLVARQPEDRGHVVKVRHLAALATSRVPEQCICKIPSLMLCYLLVDTLFPVSVCLRQTLKK